MAFFLIFFWWEIEARINRRREHLPNALFYLLFTFFLLILVFIDLSLSYLLLLIFVLIPIGIFFIAVFGYVLLVGIFGIILLVINKTLSNKKGLRGIFTALGVVSFILANALQFLAG